MSWRACYLGEVVGRAPTREAAQALIRSHFATVVDEATGERWLLHPGTGWAPTVPQPIGSTPAPDPARWPPLRPRADLDG